MVVLHSLSCPRGLPRLLSCLWSGIAVSQNYELSKNQSSSPYECTPTPSLASPQHEGMEATAQYARDVHHHRRSLPYIQTHTRRCSNTQPIQNIQHVQHNIHRRYRVCFIIMHQDLVCIIFLSLTWFFGIKSVPGRLTQSFRGHARCAILM